MKHPNRDQSSGFTLIEILIVIVIISILTAIAIPAYLSQRGKAKNAAVRDGIHSIQIGVQSYALDNGDAYPPAVAGSATLVDSNGKAYVDQWPKNPVSGAPMQDSSAQGDYSYTSAATNSFKLVGHMVSGSDFTVP
jgi:type II secretion system protein G